MMGDFVDDAIYGALNSDADPANDVDMFFNNAGGIRTDWCDKETRQPGTYVWSSTGCRLLAGRLDPRPDAADLRPDVPDPAVRQRHRRRAR